MESFVLGFGPTATSLRVLPGVSTPLPVSDAVKAGWVGRQGPGIDAPQWPRGPLTGLPMAHVITLELPPDYRRHGDEFVGIAFFQGEGQFAQAANHDDDGDPFARQWAMATTHPHLCLRQDVIDGRFALIWLTRDELDAPRCDPPEDVRRPGEHTDDDQGPNAWDADYVEADVWLAVREDPNTGKGVDDDDCVDVFDDDAFEEFRNEALGTSHLGGTMFFIQGPPDGFTPYYLELEQFGPLNLGGGNCQIDLESDAFDWACD